MLQLLRMWVVIFYANSSCRFYDILKQTCLNTNTTCPDSLGNPVQYPDKSVVERCAIINDYLDKNNEVLEMWSRAKGDNLFGGMIYIIIGVILLLSSWIVFRQVQKAKSKKRRLGKRK